MRIAMRHLLLLAAALTTSGRAFGEPRDAGVAAAAQKLFEEGRALVQAGDYATACPKFAASHRLDPGAGTLLNLGECYEKTDKLASAWATYREAEALAKASSQQERATTFAARSQVLHAKLSYLTIEAPAPAVRPSGLSIQHNGEAIPEAGWATPIPVDGGEHVIEARAPGRQAWKKSVFVKPSSARVGVKVPELAKVKEGGFPTRESSQTETSIQPVLGWTAIGVGGAALGTGLVFGAIAMSKNNEANANGHCTPADCDAEGNDLVQSAARASRASTILVLSGIGVAIVGAVLLLTAPPPPRSGSSGSGPALRISRSSFTLEW